eukprot:11936628-Heterocapsa_arctica.AAC.1
MSEKINFTHEGCLPTNPSGHSANLWAQLQHGNLLVTALDQGGGRTSSAKLRPKQRGTDIGVLGVRNPF